MTYITFILLNVFKKKSNVFQHLDMAEIIEPPLRVQVMVAQTQAGMWRRNGYSLLNQVRHGYFDLLDYRSASPFFHIFVKN